MAKVIKDGDCKQVLMVYLGDQIFGIPILQIQDVIRGQKLTHVPLAPSYIGGVMNLRGRIVTAINLRNRIDFDDTGSSSENMSIVVEYGGELFSLVVDRVGDVMELDPEKIEEPPMTLNPVWKEIACGVYQTADKIMVLLDTESILKQDNL